MATETGPFDAIATFNASVLPDVTFTQPWASTYPKELARTFQGEFYVMFLKTQVSIRCYLNLEPNSCLVRPTISVLAKIRSIRVFRGDPAMGQHPLKMRDIKTWLVCFKYLENIKFKGVTQYKDNLIGSEVLPTITTIVAKSPAGEGRGEEAALTN